MSRSRSSHVLGELALLFRHRMDALAVSGLTTEGVMNYASTCTIRA